MSRIGKKPVDIPQGVEVKIQNSVLSTKGPLGLLEYTIPDGISVEVQGASVVVARDTDQKRHRALHGLVRSLVSNMVTGVSVGFTRTLEIVGIGYRAKKEGKVLNLAVGYSHPVEFVEPEGITIDVEGQNKVIVKGIDKQKVGQVAADIRKVRKPEPYKGKGIRYSDEVVRKKVGKTAG
ncbi:50S ribosomal protein L6 [candidate division KSB3 bacterium]|uniref:Large ribosomal subunit protein uL6 n=1 Tax=candidate division KSB3 bacterium TaxID=2044937 RepID=A0A2G6E2J5_9BACT|nr:MAG: 50S ribosomal protein L6 [candidate division KSB3 bacterium]PIE28559.1 MAG: 50S ribosomal protein L6 [candidate division KSB3 bacterium]